MPKNGEDWSKLIVAKGFKKLPKVQNITQSGHTGYKSIFGGNLLESLEFPLKSNKFGQKTVLELIFVCIKKYCNFVQVWASEKTVLEFLNFGKSRFHPKMLITSAPSDT